VKPSLLLLVIVTLIESQLLYAFAPNRRRAYVPVLVLTAIGIALGQAWANAGFPALKLGEAAVLPGLLFALLLQPLASRFPSLPRRRRTPVQVDEQTTER
jgi:hypothetical protein